MVVFVSTGIFSYFFANAHGVLGVRGTPASFTIVLVIQVLV